MKTIWMSLLGLFFLVPVGSAQIPLAAGYSPVFKIGAGYSFASADVPSRGSLIMNGIGVTGRLDLNARFGMDLEVNYVRSSGVFSTSHSADLLTYIGGPVFYPKRGRRLDIYAHALFGGARETGVNFDESGGLILGFVNKFAWAVGAGAEYKLDRNLSMRFGADYLNTEFSSPTTALKHQNNVQTFIGFTYRFGGRKL